MDGTPSLAPRLSVLCPPSLFLLPGPSLPPPRPRLQWLAGHPDLKCNGRRPPGRVVLLSVRPRVSPTDRRCFAGYIIPRGWNIYLNYRNVHMDPQLYPNPSKFDPSRFLEAPKPYTFLPFGAGARYCLGNELVKIESLIFIHYLVTTCRYAVLCAVCCALRTPPSLLLSFYG